MPDRPVEQLTVREMFTEVERLMREMVEHMDHGFLPKVNDLRRLSRQREIEQVEDVTIRNAADRLLDSENYSREVYDKIQTYLQAIRGSVERIVNEG